MTITRAGGVTLFTGTEVPETHEKVSIDGGAVHIDADDPEHVLRIKHDKGDGVDILCAIDNVTNGNTARIDSDGVAHVANVKTLSKDYNDLFETIEGVVVSNAQSIGTLGGIVTAATATDNGTANNLVMRNQAVGTNIDNLHVIASAANYTNTFPPPGLYFTTGTCSESVDLIADARLDFQPYSPGGSPVSSRNFSFGRAVPLVGEAPAEADHKRDGILIEDDAVNHSCEIMCSNELPTVRLVGTKATTTSGGYTEPVCPVIEMQDGSGTTQFAVYDDGFVVQRGHQDTDPDALNSGHFNSVVTGDSSVYVGSSKISYDRAVKALRFSTLKEAVPVFLAGKGVSAAPSGHTFASMTVHAWVAYARQHQSNERLTVHDVFPSGSDDWDDAAIRARTVRTNRIREEDDSTLQMFRAQTMLAGDSSVWLGDKLHISDRDGRAQMQVRLETIPVALQALGVQTSDLTAIGKTAATATLDDWMTLSVAAGGSDDLTVIFPVANQASDFELRTIVNELLVKPQTNNAPAGITIDQAAGGHPVLHLKGNAAGNGLIMFGDQSQSFSEIYRSTATGNLELVNTYGKVRVEATALDLSANTLLTREGVSIEGGSARTSTSTAATGAQPRTARCCSRIRP